MLVQRRVFNSVRFDQRYNGSAYREETDFCLSAWAAGYRVYFCSEAVMVHLARPFSGGQRRRSRLAYEWSAFRNNLRMLRKHNALLRSRFEVTSPLWLLQGRFVGGRLGAVVRGLARSFRG
jgi:GT2 family glycosyltransferase